mmetsp:Transcript_4520/g.10710  ORF Transcript_4520/g.10710 Transcript_4520/m.10710 type:complete len:90 (+) Transcript_4520:50-319(+)
MALIERAMVYGNCRAATDPTIKKVKRKVGNKAQNTLWVPYHHWKAVKSSSGRQQHILMVVNKNRSPLATSGAHGFDRKGHGLWELSCSN